MTFTLSYIIMLETCYALLTIKLEFGGKKFSIGHQQTNYISRLMVDNFTHRKVQCLHLDVSFEGRYKVFATSYLKL